MANRRLVRNFSKSSPDWLGKLARALKQHESTVHKQKLGLAEEVLASFQLLRMQRKQTVTKKKKLTTTTTVLEKIMLLANKLKLQRSDRNKR